MPVVSKVLNRVKYPLIIHPALKLPGDFRCSRAVINHHIRIIAHLPQSIYPVQVLFMSAAIIGQDINAPPAATFNRGQLQKTPEIPGQVLIRIISGKMHCFGTYPVQQRHIVRRNQADVQPLGEIHPCVAFGKL